MKNNSEFKKFDDAMTKLLQVPHSEIKAKLEQEKAEKAKNPKKAKVQKNG